VVGGQAKLLDGVLVAGAKRHGPHLLHGRQQQPDQNRDDGDHHDQFDEREGRAARHHFFLAGGSAFFQPSITMVGAGGVFISAGITSSLVSGIFLTFSGFWPSRNSSGPRMSS